MMMMMMKSRPVSARIQAQTQKKVIKPGNEHHAHEHFLK